ncbi:MAG: hypothetical protein CSYNP_03655 [Syntrophus sp. SKADARSKE-3]|nr:hypothetical protein [Syntrophus sp. SKADARSKE-3]
MKNQDNNTDKSISYRHITERIEGDKIILSSQSNFPKKLIIISDKTEKEYRLIKTQSGGYQLNK